MSDLENKKPVYSGPRRADFPLLGLRFLIVDDVKATRNVIKRILFSLNVEFNCLFSAESVLEAQTILDENDVDVIICDLNLGDGKGIDLLRYVRASPRLMSTPFILITNDPIKDEIVIARQLGVSSFLLKPLSIDNVSEHVSKAILAAN